MARVNPTKLVTSTVEQTLRQNAAVADRMYEEMAQIDQDRASVLSLDKEYKDQGIKPPAALRVRLRELTRDYKALEGQVARYSNASLKDIEKKLEMYKGTPGAAFYGDLLRDMQRRLLRAKKKAQFRGADVREEINQLRGDVATLKQGLPVAGIPKTKRSAAQKDTVKDAYEDQVARWKKVGRRLEWPKHRRFKETADWIGLQLTVIKRKLARGEADVGTSIRRVAKKIDEVEAVTLPRAKLKTAADARKIIASVRRKAAAMRKAARRSPKEIEALEQKIDALGSSFRAREKAKWTRRDEKAIAQDIQDLKSLAKSMKGAKGAPKHPVRLKAGNPKKKKTKRKAAKKKTAKKKKRAKKATKKDIKRITRHQEASLRGGAVGTAVGGTVGALTAGPVGAAVGAGTGAYVGAKAAKSKKSNAKKKRTKKTPDWQRLIRRCQKLWEHYCERPSKKRLQDVIKHLETMKQSSSKKVLDERKLCIRAVNKEKKRWKV